MRIIATLLATALLLSAAEPRKEIVLVIDGKEVRVPDGGSVQIGGSAVQARIGANQVFTGDGYELALPAHYSFERDTEDPAAITYTFDGRNVVLTIYELPADRDIPAFIDEMVTGIAAALKVRKLARKPAEAFVIGGAARPGLEIGMPVAGTNLILSLHELPRGRGKLLATIQRSPDAADAAELAELLAVLKDGFASRP
jgi:hypothetical protein